MSATADPVTNAYAMGLRKAMELIEEERESRGGEASCACSDIVALDNARHRVDEHRVSIENGIAPPDLAVPHP